MHEPATVANSQAIPFLLYCFVWVSFICFPVQDCTLYGRVHHSKQIALSWGDGREKHVLNSWRARKVAHPQSHSITSTKETRAARCQDARVRTVRYCSSRVPSSATQHDNLYNVESIVSQVRLLFNQKKPSLTSYLLPSPMLLSSLCLVE